MYVCVLSPVQLVVTPLFMGFSRQEYWSGLPIPPPGDLPHSVIEPASPALQAFFTTEPPGKPNIYRVYIKEITNKDLLYSSRDSTQYL